MSTVIAVTSGKGGTGKTSLVGAVSSCLAALGYSTLCIDMDVGCEIWTCPWALLTGR